MKQKFTKLQNEHTKATLQLKDLEAQNLTLNRDVNEFRTTSNSYKNKLNILENELFDLNSQMSDKDSVLMK